MPLHVNAKTLEEIEKRFIAELGFAPEVTRQLFDELKQAPEELVKVLDSFDGVADGAVELSQVMTVIMQGLLKMHSTFNDFKSENSALWELYDKKKEVLTPLFEAYSQQMKTQMPNIQREMKKQGTYILAIHGKMANGKTSWLRNLKQAFWPTGYKPGKLNALADRAQQVLKKASIQFKRVHSKTENGEDYAAQLFGIVTELVNMQKEAMRKVPGVMIEKQEKVETKQVDANAEVAVMEPEVKEQVGEDIYPELGAILAKLDMFEARLNIFTALLEDLDNDVEVSLAGFDELAIS